MKRSVFISSTYQDLIESRKLLWEMLIKFNINIKGMEKFGARSETSLETCLKEVENCDIYIGIIAFNYGSIDSITNKSYTHLEYDKAIECNKTIRLYLLDEQNASIKTRNINFDNIDKIITFRSELKKKHTVQFYTDNNDLISKVKSDVLSLIEINDVEELIKLSEYIVKVDENARLYLKEKYNLKEPPTTMHISMYYEKEDFQKESSIWFINELKKYDLNTLKRLVALMYVGRDNEEFDYAYRVFADREKEELMRILFDRVTNLPEYLKKGLKRISK